MAPFDLALKEEELLSEVSKYIFTSKYARYLEDLKRRETKDEAVDRVLDMHLRKFNDLPEDRIEEIRWAFDQVRADKVIPSMRTFQFGGKAMEVNNARGYNCCMTYAHSVRSIAEVFFLLLCGCGVGVSLTKKYIDRFPDLADASDKTGSVLVYTIEDSIEGWSDSIEVLMNCYLRGNPFTGRRIVFDYSKIRAKGSPLKTSGGKAPGYEGLKAAHLKIKELLDRAIEVNEQRRLKSIDIYDICCHISDAVLSGGVRRSAMLMLFDRDDEEMMNAKIGDWFEENPQRARTNNTVILPPGEVTLEEFKFIAQRTREWGEPGYAFISEDTVINPCAEVTTIPVTKDGVPGVQMCVSGDTPIITKEGISVIQKLVGKTVDIWNGNEWTATTPFQTGTSDELYRVEFSDGSYLDVTSNHKFLAKTHSMKEFKEYSTLGMIDYLQNFKSPLYIPRANVIAPTTGEFSEYAYEYGYFKGDGHLDHGQPKACLFGKDSSLGIRGISMGWFKNPEGTDFEVKKLIDLKPEFCRELKRHLPDSIFSWDEDSVMEFMGGWIDADGSQANNGCRLYGDELSIRKAQLLLTKFGINSSCNLMQDKGVETNKGIRNHAIWYLQVPNASKIHSRRLNLSNGQNARWKGKNQLIRSVTKLEGLHKSYCLEEPKLHQCLFGNVLTKQCNLTSINGGRIKSREDFLSAVKAATIIGTLQASYTDFHYLSTASREITEEESLLGVSITAMFESPEILLDSEIQNEASNYAVDINEEWADVIGIPHAARVTLLKPEGSGTLSMGSMFSGIHPAHAPVQWRRVQANKEDNVYKFFKEYNPHLCEESVWSSNRTDDVITFPIVNPVGAIFKKDLKAIDHLEIIKSTQKNWVNPGSRNSIKPLQHSISCTVVVEDDEWEKVMNYLYDNQEYFTAVSLLGSGSDKEYKQAPNEEVITEEEIALFKSQIDNFIPIDYTLMVEEEDNTDHTGEASCVRGRCVA